MKKIFTALVFFIFLSVQGQQISGTVSGTVQDTYGDPLPFASVLVEGIKLGVLTDENGFYSLNNVPKGKYKLVVSFVGYGTGSIPFEIQDNSRKVNLDFTLQESTEDLDEVTINGKSKETKLETTGFTVSAIKTEEASLRNIQTNELLNTTVGVKIRQNGGLGSEVTYSLNGLSGNSVRIFIDGIPISTYGNSFNLNSIPPSMIKNIEVYKGVVPVI